MHVDQFVKDTAELSRYLLKRFHKKKLYLMGHSWGTLLGVLAVTWYPELYYAYGGIGQFVEGKENEEIGHRYALERAREPATGRPWESWPPWRTTPRP